jgi:predicted nucleic acid-binding protein
MLENWLERELIPRFHPRILPVTLAVANRWGSMDGMRRLAGRPLNTADGMIAATAAEWGLVLVTRNVRDFTQLPVELLNAWEYGAKSVETSS